MLNKFLLALVMVLGISTFSYPTLAAGGGEEAKEEEGPPKPPEIGYYDMTPDFTTNLASSGTGRLHYLRVHVTVMVKDSNDIPLLEDHEPLIRDAILNIIGTKEYGAIATSAGREALRAECRARVAELMGQKKNAPVLQDLLFTNYVYQ